MAGEQTIDELNIKINAEAKQSSSGLDKLVSSIERLKSATGGGVGQLTGIAASISKLSAGLSGMKSQSGIVSSLANSIQKLNDAKTDRISGSISTLTASLKTLGGMDPTLKTLIADLATLAKSGTGGVSGNALSLEAAAAKAQATIDQSALKSAKAQEGLQAIADKNKAIEDSARAAAQQEQQLTDSISTAIQEHITQYGSAGGFSNKTAAGLESVLPDYGAETSAWPKNAPSEINAASINALKSAMGGVGSAASSAMSEVSSGSSRAASFVDKLKQSLSDAKDKLSGLGTSSSGFFNMGRFYGWYFILRQIASVFGGFINNINSYIENVNLFDVAMGSAAQSGEKLANSLQSVLGIDSGEAVRYMGVFQELGSSFGIANKQAVTMSENMTQLGYDLASFYNINTGTAFEKLESVYTGQSRAARSLGIDISNARLQQELYNLGIKEKVNDLTQADKAELRYIAIMKQTTNAQGDMARTIQTPANALRVLQAQLSITGRAIGSIFIPALEAILPVVTAVIEVIGDLASELASLFGFKMPKIDYSSLTDLTNSADDATDSLGNVGNGVGDVGKKAKDTKKDLDNLISGFDELNIIQTDTSSDTDTGSSGAGGAGGGNILSGIDLPSYNALADAVSNNIDAIKAKLEQYKPLIEEILKDVLAVGAALLTWKLTTGFFNGLMNLLPGLKEFKGQFVEIAAGLALVAGLFTFAYTHSENFRKGLVVLGQGFQEIGKAIADFASGAAKSLGIKELSGEFWTSTAAVIAIAIGVVATALGAPIFGAIAIIAGVSVLAIQGIGYAASNSIEPVNLFGEGISDATEKKLKPFIKECDELDETIKGLKWGGQIITDKDVSNVRSQVKTIADTLINGLDADKNTALKNLNPLKNMLDSKTYDSIIQASGKYYDQQKTTVQQGEDQINTIMQKAKDQHRTLTQGESDEILKIKSNMETTGIKNLTQSQTESNLIFQSLKDNHSALSAQEAAAIVQNSAKQRDTTIGDANKQYDGIMTEAQRMYDVGAINKDQYDKIAQAAGKSKDDTIKQAAEQHTKIVDEAKKQSGDLSDQIDWSTGSIKSKWQVFWEDTQKRFSDGWNSVNQFFQKSLPEWWKDTVSPWFTKEKWQGIADNMKAGIQDKWNEFTGWWNQWGPVVWWKDNVSPWFTKEKWTQLYDAVKTSLSGKWNDTVAWWNQLGPTVWWKDNVAPWFTKAKWDDLYKNIKQSITDAWNSAVTWWNNLGPVKWWKEDVAPWFTAEKWSNLGKDAMNGLVSGIQSIHIPTPHFEFGWESIDNYDNLAAKAAKALGYGGGVPTLDINWYAGGGIFDMPSVIGVGEYSGASSNPEVVAPQSIIRETVTEGNEGLAEAIIAAAERIVAAINEKDTSVNIDGKTAAKTINKANDNSGYFLGIRAT